MNNQAAAAHAMPRSVSLFNPVAKVLLAGGIRLGFNGLITIPGRTTGLPRTTPLAIIEFSGRRWVWSPWGDSHWVRNLRAAGRATITAGRQKHEVTARELDAGERVAFFRDVLGPVAGGIPLGKWFIRAFDGVDLDRPTEAADGRRVFELQGAEGASLSGPPWHPNARTLRVRRVDDRPSQRPIRGGQSTHGVPRGHVGGVLLDAGEARRLPDHEPC